MRAGLVSRSEEKKRSPDMTSIAGRRFVCWTIDRRFPDDWYTGYIPSSA